MVNGSLNWKKNQKEKSPDLKLNELSKNFSNKKVSIIIKFLLLL